MEGGIFENVFIAIDTTECPIGTKHNALYSGYKKKFTYKYEAAISLYSGEFVWLPEEELRGPVSDQQSFRIHNIVSHMEEEERFVGDTHYAGLPKSMSTSVKEYKKDKKLLGRVRCIVENGFGRVKKTFNCMHYPWRHNIFAHPLAFKVCVHITNMTFKYHPLRNEPHHLLLQKLN